MTYDCQQCFQEVNAVYSKITGLRGSWVCETCLDIPVDKRVYKKRDKHIME